MKKHTQSKPIPYPKTDDLFFVYLKYKIKQHDK